MRCEVIEDSLYIRYIGFIFSAWLTSFIWYSESSKQLCFLVHPILSHAMISNFRLLFADIFNISVSFWLLHSDQGQFIFPIVEIFIFIECHLVAEFHRWVFALSLSNLHEKLISRWSVILRLCRSGLLFFILLWTLKTLLYKWFYSKLHFKKNVIMSIFHHSFCFRFLGFLAIKYWGVRLDCQSPSEKLCFKNLTKLLIFLSI